MFRSVETRGLTPAIAVTLFQITGNGVNPAIQPHLPDCVYSAFKHVHVPFGIAANRAGGY